MFLIPAKNLPRHKILLLLCSMLFSLPLAFAVQEGAEIHKEEKFNAGKLIIEHISDAHDWHIMDIPGHAVSIPLPVIIWHEERGISVFMSGKFEHGNADHNGYRLVNNHIVAVNENGVADEASTAMIWDFSITKNVAALFFSVLFILVIFISVSKAYSRNTNKSPRGIRSLIEPFILFVRDDIAKSNINKKKYEKYLPYLLTIFFFIWINNMLGLIPIPPGGTNLTGNIAVTMTLALFTFIIVIFSTNQHYWKHILAMPGVPVPILFILTPIEIFGFFLKHAILMIRLFANITAGHIIGLSFFSLIFIFGEMNIIAGYGVSVLSVAFALFMTMLELLVAFIQAYVFTLLSAVFIGMAVEEPKH